MIESSRRRGGRWLLNLGSGASCPQLEKKHRVTLHEFGPGGDPGANGRAATRSQLRAIVAIERSVRVPRPPRRTRHPGMSRL